MIAAMAEANVGRASLGVQDFDPEVQSAVNRRQPFELTERAIQRLRAAGIARINLDLIYGLPRQTTASVLRTVDLAIELHPQRLALFGYAHVPRMKPHQRLLPTMELPDGEARWAQATAAAEWLQRAGYRWIGLDHFALPEDELTLAAEGRRLRRNFQGYTTDLAGSLIGLGASSIGSLPQGYVQNATDIKSWQSRVETGALPIARGIALTNEDRLRRHVIERLMCDLEIDLAATAEAFGKPIDHFRLERTVLEELVGEGLIEANADRIRLTKRGRPLMRLVAAVFDRNLAPYSVHHSRAV